MNWLQHIEFVHPWWLSALLLVPVLVIWYIKKLRKRSAHMRISTIEPIRELTSLRSKLYPYLPLLSLLSFIGLVLALARPQLTLKEEEIKAEGIDIVIAMDVSSSMLAKDFEPDRLSASKEVAKSFVDQREHDRIGLVVCGILEDGTAIGMGLASAVNRLKESEAKSKVVILLTDGVNNSGYIKPMTAAEIAKELDTRVYTIGVGTRGRALVPDRRRGDGDYIYNMVQVNIDEGLLQEIADDTGGKYYRATDLETLQRIYDEINTLEKTEMQITSIRRYSEEFRPFLLIAVIALLLEVLLRMTVFRTIP